MIPGVYKVHESKGNSWLSKCKCPNCGGDRVWKHYAYPFGVGPKRQLVKKCRNCSYLHVGKLIKF